MPAAFVFPAAPLTAFPPIRIGNIIFENIIAGGRSEHGTGREIVIDLEFVLRGSTGLAPNPDKNQRAK